MKINWKQVGWTSLKVFIVLIMNTPLWVYLIGSMVPYDKVPLSSGDGFIKLSWIDYLKLSDKVEWYQIWILYFFVGLMLILTFFFIKWLISEAKRTKEKNEMIQAQENQTKQIVEAIQKEKQEKEIKKELKLKEKANKADKYM